MRVWTEAVKLAIQRHIAATGSPIFTRRAFFAAELAALEKATGTVGVTPMQTATREFQVLRDEGLLQFVAPGTYRWLGDMPAIEPDLPSNAVFVLGARADRAVSPERGYSFAAEWVRTARRAAEQWIVYQGTRGYGAAALVERIEAQEGGSNLFLARIKEGSYLEFGNTVPLMIDGRPIEQSLRRAGDGLDPALAAPPVRAITRDEFNRILNLGLVEEDEVLPRFDEESSSLEAVEDERVPFVAQVDRTTELSSRKVRDRQFRKRVLDAYGARCALTG